MFTGWPVQVIGEVAAAVARIIGTRRQSRGFKIGRTVDPQQRFNQHRADELHVIYSTSSIDHAITVENALINYFANDERSLNQALHGGGGVSYDYDHHVYVAVWR